MSTEPVAMASAVLTLVKIGKELSDMLVEATDYPVARKVLTYLKVVQKAIRELGQERQRILSDAACCQLDNDSDVMNLERRLENYLRVDNVRPSMKKAVEGLGKCREAVEGLSAGLRWRKRDKQRAVQSFVRTLKDLEDHLVSLENTFFPGRSGEGLVTLRPIDELVKRISKKGTRDLEADEELLEDLVRAASRDLAHTKWLNEEAEVERLIVELQLTFSVNSEPAPKPAG